MAKTVSGLWMRLFVYIEQIFRIHVRVALCRGQAGVPQEFLNRPKVSAPLQQVSREGVTKGVGAGLCAYRSPDKAPCDDPSHGSVREGLASDTLEHRIPSRNLPSS